MLCVWRMIELEEVLPEINDIATLKTITRSRPVPPQLRPKVWQVCKHHPHFCLPILFKMNIDSIDSLLVFSVCCSLQICINIASKGNPFSSFDELYDLPEQSLLREDCKAVVGMNSRFALWLNFVIVIDICFLSANMFAFPVWKFRNSSCSCYVCINFFELEWEFGSLFWKPIMVFLQTCSSAIVYFDYMDLVYPVSQQVLMSSVTCIVTTFTQ